MPRVLSSPEIVERRRDMAPDHPRHIVMAWRCGRRDATKPRPRVYDPWPFDDHPATIAAYADGWNGRPRPRSR